MNMLLSILETNERIPSEYRMAKTLAEIKFDLTNIALAGLKVTNQHVLNLISVISPKQKTVTKIEDAGEKRTMDLEIDHESHSYFANGTPTHNTANIPHDYPYQDFKTLYLNVYNTGFIKGFTTYRAGTMTSVLSAKDEGSNRADEEIILDDIQLPDSLPATLKTLKAEGRKWYLTVIQNEAQTRPVAFFVQTNAHEKSITATDAVEQLLALARAKGIPEKHVSAVEAKIASDNNASKICRTISLNLRHGVLIKSIVAALEKVDCVVGSFVFHVRKFLASFIKDGEKVADEKCSECGSDKVVYQEGCKVCANCGSSKCG